MFWRTVSRWMKQAPYFERKDMLRRVEMASSTSLAAVLKDLLLTHGSTANAILSTAEATTNIHRKIEASLPFLSFATSVEVLVVLTSAEFNWWARREPHTDGSSLASFLNTEANLVSNAAAAKAGGVGQDKLTAAQTLDSLRQFRRLRKLIVDMQGVAPTPRRRSMIDTMMSRYKKLLKATFHTLRKDTTASDWDAEQLRELFDIAKSHGSRNELTVGNWDMPASWHLLVPPLSPEANVAEVQNVALEKVWVLICHPRTDGNRHSYVAEVVSSLFSKPVFTPTSQHGTGFSVGLKKLPSVMPMHRIAASIPMVALGSVASAALHYPNKVLHKAWRPHPTDVGMVETLTLPRLVEELCSKKRLRGQLSRILRVAASPAHTHETVTTNQVSAVLRVAQFCGATRPDCDEHSLICMHIVREAALLVKTDASVRAAHPVESAVILSVAEATVADLADGNLEEVLQRIASGDVSATRGASGSTLTFLCRMAQPFADQGAVDIEGDEEDQMMNNYHALLNTLATLLSNKRGYTTPLKAAKLASELISAYPSSDIVDSLTSLLDIVATDHRFAQRHPPIAKELYDLLCVCGGSFSHPQLHHSLDMHLKPPARQRTSTSKAPRPPVAPPPPPPQVRQAPKQQQHFTFLQKQTVEFLTTFINNRTTPNVEAALSILQLHKSTKKPHHTSASQQSPPNLQELFMSNKERRKKVKRAFSEAAVQFHPDTSSHSNAPLRFRALVVARDTLL